MQVSDIKNLLTQYPEEMKVVSSTGVAINMIKTETVREDEILHNGSDEIVLVLDIQ